MGRWLCLTWAASAACVAAGCATGPLQDNPVLVSAAASPAANDNPVYVPLGPDSYPLVYDKVLDVLDDYFEIAYTSRHSGTIETFPRVSPGLGQPWKPGSPDLYQRTLATLQTIRHRAVVRITVAEDHGFFVDVEVLKELEDLANPIRSTAGSASFRSAPTVERQYEVVEGGQFETNWIPIGRDCQLEQVILARIARFDIAGLRPARPADCPPRACPPPQPAPGSATLQPPTPVGP